MKQLLIIALVTIALGCAPSEKPSPESYLQEVAEQMGRDQLNNKQLEFEMAGLTYISSRKGNEYRFSMTRVIDTVTYKAVAYNGGFEYTENGKAKSYGAQNRQVETQLLALNHFMEIPELFLNDNSIKLAYKEPVIIDNTTYDVIHVAYTTMMPTDLIENYNLYIDQQDKTIDFIGYDFAPAKDRLFFRESFNRRKVDGMIVDDYRTYRTRSGGVSLDSLPYLFLKNELDLTAAFTPENVKLTTND